MTNPDGAEDDSGTVGPSAAYIGLLHAPVVLRAQPIRFTL